MPMIWRSLLFGLVLVACKTREAPAPAPARQAARTSRPVPPALPAAQERSTQLWATAEAAPTPVAWDAVAASLDDTLRSCVERATCRDLARRALLARKNAVTAEKLPRPENVSSPIDLPPRVQAMVSAADRFVELAEPDDPEVPGTRFVAASSLSRYGWSSEAIPRFEDIIRLHAEHEVGEYAVNLLLDWFNRTGNYDQLVQWAATMLEDPAILAGRPELRVTLEAIITAARNAQQ